MGNIFLIGWKSSCATLLLEKCLFQCGHNLQHVVDIIIHFGQHFFKFSASFSVIWLVTIDHWSYSQSDLSCTLVHWTLSSTWKSVPHSQKTIPSLSIASLNIREVENCLIVQKTDKNSRYQHVGRHYQGYVLQLGSYFYIVNPVMHRPF